MSFGNGISSLTPAPYDPRVLERIERFRIPGGRLIVEPKLMGSGTYSDVFRGILRREDGGQVMVAIKRLRIRASGASQVRSGILCFFRRFTYAFLRYLI